MHRCLSLLALLIIGCGPAVDALAQEKDKGGGVINPKLNPDDCDVSFTSTIRAKTLRVDAVGNPKVEFHGSANREVLFDVKRANFPKPIQPGRTYNNIKVDMKILTKFTEPKTEGEPQQPAEAKPAVEQKQSAEQKK